MQRGRLFTGLILLACTSQTETGDPLPEDDAGTRGHGGDRGAESLASGGGTETGTGGKTPIPASSGGAANIVDSGHVEPEASAASETGPEPDSAPPDNPERDAAPDGAPPVGECELDVVMMIDRSGSMVGFDGFSNAGVDLWTPIGSAIGVFVAETPLEGMNASIQFFPLPLNAQSQLLNPSATEVCDVSQYASPSAPMGPLPANSRAIQNAIVSHNPLQGGTPTRPALEGAVQYARSIQRQNPGHKVIVLLATDGAPNDCQSDLLSVSNVARDAFISGIAVHVIGIGNIDGLNQIAIAGGTEAAYVVDADPSVAALQFHATLEAVYDREACE